MHFIALLNRKSPYLICARAMQDTHPSDAPAWHCKWGQAALPARVLVIDDDPALLHSLKELLTFRMSVEVETCESPLAALDDIRRVDFDAIICDIKMPRMDGLDLMKSVHAVRPATPTLLITGHGDHDLGVKALNAGAYAFITKPIDRDFFVAWLQRAIQLRQLTRRVEEQNKVLQRQTEDLERLVAARTASLHESQQRLRRALEFDDAVMANMGEGLYALNGEGLVTYVNPVAEKLFGWAGVDLLGRKMHDVVHYKHRDGRPFPAQECPGLEVLLKGTVLTEYRDTFIRRDGTFFDVVYSSSPIVSEQAITGLVVVFREVGTQPAS